MSTDKRQKLQTSALEIAQRYEQQTVDRLRRMGIAAAGIEVVGVRNKLAPINMGNEGVYEFGDSHLV